jgi:hypothetical protein
MNGQQLGITEEEVDIGVAMVGSLKPSVQCRRAARTAQTVLGQLARGIHNRDRNLPETVPTVYEAAPGVCEPGLESLAGGRQRVPG